MSVTKMQHNNASIYNAVSHCRQWISSSTAFSACTESAHFQSVHLSSETHCHLTSNNPGLCPSSVNVLKHSFFVSLFLTQFCDSTEPSSWQSLPLCQLSAEHLLGDACVGHSRDVIIIIKRRLILRRNMPRDITSTSIGTVTGAGMLRCQKYHMFSGLHFCHKKMQTVSKSSLTCNIMYHDCPQKACYKNSSSFTNIDEYIVLVYFKLSHTRRSLDSETKQ